VTHALHFLPRFDYIICVEHGMITETGTYAELMSKQGAFSRLMTEFGGSPEDEKKVEEEGGNVEGEKKDEKKKQNKGAALMQQEERVVGASSAVYLNFLKAAEVTLSF
jgi:ATP-binding cassette, subfamily C (CFTR/MRP), member 1